jgi:hypothetical protein
MSFKVAALYPCKTLSQRQFAFDIAGSVERRFCHLCPGTFLADITLLKSFSDKQSRSITARAHPAVKDVLRSNSR